MELKLQKWGNSLGIRIPSALLKSLNIGPNDVIDLVQDGNKIIITKSNKGRISLEERFRTYNGNNLAKDFEWDESRGKEIW